MCLILCIQNQLNRVEDDLGIQQRFMIKAEFAQFAINMESHKDSPSSHNSHSKWYDATSIQKIYDWKDK